MPVFDVPVIAPSSTGIVEFFRGPGLKVRVTVGRICVRTCYEGTPGVHTLTIFRRVIPKLLNIVRALGYIAVEGLDFVTSPFNREKISTAKSKLYKTRTDVDFSW